eukprot:353547-Chlamydomonas_euryale.AAC.4
MPRPPPPEPTDVLHAPPCIARRCAARTAVQLAWMCSTYCQATRMDVLRSWVDVVPCMIRGAGCGCDCVSQFCGQR